MTTHGYPQPQRDAAKADTLDILIGKARRQRTIAYSDLAAEITSIRFNAEDRPFHNLLGEISVEEEQAGRGMISVVVVHKQGDMRPGPGPGFFKLALSLGRPNRDELELWVEELQRVFAAHRR